MFPQPKGKQYTHAVSRSLETFEGESFLREIWGVVKFGAWCPLVLQKQAIRERFLRENCIFHLFTTVSSLESINLDKHLDYFNLSHKLCVNVRYAS